MADSRVSIAAIVVAYFLVYVVWGSTYFFIGVALQGLPVFLLGALRFSAAGLILLALCAVRGERLLHPRLIRRSAVSGIMLLFVDMTVIMLAQRYVSSSLVAIVASSTAVWIMLLDVPAWRQTFRNPAAVAGILMGFAGVAMLYAEQLGMSAESTHGERGVALLVGGCLSWAAGTLFTKYRSCVGSGSQGFSGAAWQMFAASIAFWVCALLCGDVRTTDFGSVPRKAWLALFYLITCGSILAYTAYVWLLRVRPATEVATHAYVNPVVAVAIGAGIGGETVTAVQLAGLAVILISVALVGLKSHRMSVRHGNRRQSIDSDNTETKANTDND